MKFGEKLKILLAQHKPRMTYDDFGFANAKKSTVYRWAADKSFPDLWQLKKLAEHFGVPVSYLADDRFETVDQVYSQGVTAEERQYVEMGRALGMEDAALLIGLVRKLASETSLQEVYRRLLRVDPSERSVGEEVAGGGAAHPKVHERGEGTPKPAADQKPEPRQK